MNKLAQMKEALTAAIAEARAAIDGGDKDTIQKASAKVLDLRANYEKLVEYRELEDSIAKNVPVPPADAEHVDEHGKVVRVSGWGEIRKLMVQAGTEKRAITANGAGYNTVPGIVRALVDGAKLGGKIARFFGANAVTTVPVFAPHMAVPVGSAPGATGTSSDSTAVLTGDPLTLKPWYSTLAISMGALLSTDIEGELPAIFAEAFSAAIDKMICVGAGSGSDGLGVFIASSSGVPTGSDISCTSSTGTGPNWADYVGLAMTLLGLSGGPMDSLAIVVNPAVFATALGSATEGYDPMKVEFLTKGTILGIPVILSSYALTTLTTGSYVAVGGYFRHFALAVAQEITIDPIKTVGSDNIVFQAFMYMQGKPLIGSSFRRLKTV
ncbi:MAG: phage major capsid protein [Spirochaetes bacterium]|nr:phage major capsid protein [Spirochaetota bacterium]